LLLLLLLLLQLLLLLMLLLLLSYTFSPRLRRNGTLANFLV
jgi:hypothetical protein